jgi:PAS domain S-box-containing protein
MTTSSPPDDIQSPFDDSIEARRPAKSNALARPGTFPEQLPAFRKAVGSLQQVYLALHAAEVGVWDWNVVENTVTWSLCVDKIFGLAPKRSKPSFAELLQQVAPEDVVRIKALLAELLNQGEAGRPFEFECRIYRQDGELRWIEVVGSIGQSAVLSLLGTVRDVTERRHAENAQQRRFEGRLLHAERLDNLGSVASGIAHELKNILTPILLHTQMLQEDLGAAHPAQTGLRDVIRSCTRAGDLVQQILAFSRRQEFQLMPVNLGNVVSEAVKLLKATLPASVTLQTRIASTLPLMEADATQILQVILNLGINAWHAIEPGAGVIEIGLDEIASGEDAAAIAPELNAGRYVRLSVRDNGKGMDQATLSHIYEPFFTTKPHGVGTGLGLSVVHAIVKNHLGVITVESKPGQGALFQIYFPAPPPIGARA